MQPFPVPSPFDYVTTQYPEPGELSQALTDMAPLDRIWFLRLWLTEGIPFAFREAPAIYESVREWLAGELKVHAKDLTLIGSARIGYSLAPDQYGRDFNARSDLDFTLVSEAFFQRMQAAFESWKMDVESGRITPRTSGERAYWPANLKGLPNNLARGSVDAYKIPGAYHNVNRVMWLLWAKLQATPQSPKAKSASLRVYKNWEAFLRQASINIESLSKRRKILNRASAASA